MANADWSITADKITLIQPFESEIISAISSGKMAADALINVKESIVSRCSFILGFNPSSAMCSGFAKRIDGIKLFHNSSEVFPLLDYMSPEALLSLSPGIDRLTWIKGVDRSNNNRDTSIGALVSQILSSTSEVAQEYVNQHLSLYVASRWVERYLRCLNRFHLHKSELLNAWNAAITQDIYGKEDTRKVEALICKILKDKYKLNAPDILTITRLHIRRSGSVSERNDGRNFEKRCFAILEGQGWAVAVTPVSGDYGGDLIAERDGLRWCLQCKDTLKPAGVQAVQQAAAATGYYICDYAAVVSANGFTEQAASLAARLRVGLFNDTSLKRLGDDVL